MKAILFERFGGPEVLKMADVTEPHAGDGMVRVRVKAAGVNAIDWKIRNGWMEAAFPTRFPCISGMEIAGVVDEVGNGVTDVQAGDEVLGWSEGGGYAEYALARRVIRKPFGLSWAVAASLPVAAVTARNVVNQLDLKPGETLLVHGASGAVGSVAVQLAKARGVAVIGTASAANAQFVASLGATPVLYGDGLVERVREIAPAGVDAALDTAGKGTLEPSIELAGGPERVITIVDADAQRYGVRFSAGSGDDFMEGLADVASLAAAGALTIRIAPMLPLASAAEAQRVSEGGHASGKLVLTLE